MKVIRNDDTSVLVTCGDDDMQWTAIAKHEDKDGEYFLNEKLEKQYINDTEHVEHPLDTIKKQREKDEAFRKEVENWTPKKHTYTFDVVTANKYNEPSRHYRKDVKAFSFKEAESKIREHYKRVFDAELVSVDESKNPNEWAKRLI